MERLLYANAMKAKWIIGGFVGGSVFLQKGSWENHLIWKDVYGLDGNGGHMLKIITNLTDEEMARLKYVRRLYWHWRGSRTMQWGKDSINDAELADRGVKVDEPRYIEYVKRPPHDKYL